MKTFKTISLLALIAFGVMVIGLMASDFNWYQKPTTGKKISYSLGAKEADTTVLYVRNITDLISSRSGEFYPDTIVHHVAIESPFVDSFTRLYWRTSFDSSDYTLVDSHVSLTDGADTSFTKRIYSGSLAPIYDLICVKQAKNAGDTNTVIFHVGAIGIDH